MNYPTLSRWKVFCFWARVFLPHVAHAALWLVLLCPFTVAAPQASTYDLERRVGALERQTEYVRDRVNAQDVANAARFAAIETGQKSNTEKVNMVLGVFTGVGSLLLAGLCFRIFGKRNGNGNGDKRIL